MLKAFGKLWLQGARRLAKAQVVQQKKLQKKLVKSLLPAVKKPRAAPRRRVAAAKQVNTAPASAARAGRTAPASGPRVAGKVRAPTSGGSLDSGGRWTRGYHAAALADSRTGRRRMMYWLYVPDATPAGGTGVEAISPALPLDDTAQRPVAGRARAGSAALAATRSPPVRLPLVVMLHGCDQTAEEFAQGTRMNRLAARHGFAVLYPQQSASAHAQRCWPWYKRSVQQGGDEVALVAGMLEQLVSRNGFDRSRVYVAGMSAGAALAQTLAVRHPELFAAVGSHSGPVFGVADSRLSAFSVMQAGSRDAARTAAQLLAGRADFPVMPMMIMQGEQDPVVRPVNAPQLAAQFCILNQLAPQDHETPVLRAARGANDAWRTTDHQRQGKVVVRLCEVAHLAHAWSGGDASLRYNAAQGPDASALLWDFFKRHKRR